MDLLCLRGFIDDFAQTDDITKSIQTIEHEVGMGRTFSIDSGSCCGASVIQDDSYSGDVCLEW